MDRHLVNRFLCLPTGLRESQVAIDFVRRDLVSYLVVLSTFYTRIVVDEMFSLIRGLTVWTVNRNGTKGIAQDIILTQVMHRLHQRVWQHTDASTIDLVLWRDVKIHIIRLTRIELAFHTVHAGSQGCGKAEVRAARKVRRTIFDSARASNTQHLCTVVSTISDGN